jgi:hypothetical protein
MQLLQQELAFIARNGSVYADLYCTCIHNVAHIPLLRLVAMQELALVSALVDTDHGIISSIYNIHNMVARRAYSTCA